MTTFLNRLTNRGGASSAPAHAARVTLAVFGKHPGWDDHLPGIGVGTEALVRIKHALYDTGMRGCIDSGAWKKLEADKRLEGFDHMFLWLQTGSVILGELHSSEDGLRRREYPLVLCVDGEGVSPGSMLARVQPELNRLRDACQATKSAEIVTAECLTAQERLRTSFSEAVPLAGEATSPDARQRFLDHPDLGPERVGLLRAMHELGISGDTSARPGQRSRHARLPLASDSRTQSLLLWAEFFRCAIPLPTPLLLLSRGGAEWLDVIFGEPTSDDLICLQSSTNAQPLASQIPYDLKPEVAPYLKELELKFFQSAQPTSLQSPPSATTGPAPPPLAPVGAGADALPRGNLKLLVLVLVVIVVAVGSVTAIRVMRGDRGKASRPQPQIADTNAVPVEAAPVKSNLVTSPSALGEAQLKVDAESNRLAGEKQRQDAQLRIQREAAAAEADRKRIAQEQKAADDQAKVPRPLSTTPSAEETQAQAQAGERAVGVAQIALSQGNYARALELCQKWPGVEGLQQVAARVAFETNQLAQAGNWLKSGDYDLLLTNRLPENPRFKEILAQAESEKQILDQAQLEFKNGSYSFLQRPEMPQLKSKPPFGRLLQAGDAEAGHLKSAQSLKAQNKPQEALDLTAKYQLTKPPFTEIQQWATGELSRTAQVRRDQELAETGFAQGDYARALALCERYSAMPDFAKLAGSIKEEQKVLEGVRARFVKGDYSFVSELRGSYTNKSPFAGVLVQGRSEQADLARLSALTNQVNGWQQLPGELNKLPSEVARKEPFENLRRWAQEQAAGEEQRKSKDPAWLDDKFEPLLVRFGVLSLKNRWIQSPVAANEKVMDGFLSIEAKDYYLNQVRWLRREYEQRGWLNLRDRKKYLDQLESNINGR